jgi:hypothetical protein
VEFEEAAKFSQNLLLNKPKLSDSSKSDLHRFVCF